MITKEYITQLLNRINDSDIDKSRFGPFYNLMILPIAQISSPVEYRLRSLESFQGLRNVETLSEYELDVISSNHLIFRREGGIGTASARVVVRSPKTVYIPKGAILSITKDTVKYDFISNGIVIPETDFNISPIYSSYYISSSFPVSTTSNNNDSGYNFLEPSSILTHGIADSNIVHIIFEGMVTEVTPREDNSQLYLRLLNSSGQKVLSSEAGVRTIFDEYYPQVPVVEVYGNSDSRVTRNTIGFFTPQMNEDWEVFNFKGKIAGASSVPHFAYEYLLTEEGNEYGIVEGSVLLSGLPEFLLYEASQEDYRGLYAKMSEAFFESGHNIFLSKDTFTTDPEWVKYDAYLGAAGVLHSPDEITISGLYYVLGGDIEYINWAAFIRDIMNSNPPPPPPPPGIIIATTLEID